MHTFLDHPGVLAFAHRGDHDSGPENTLPAFAGAVDQGFKYLETDTHCTRDGVLMAFHDQQLDRVTDQTGKISELDYEVVRRARVGGSETIPSLEDLIESFPEARFNIDLKADTTVIPFINLIRKLKCVDRICVGAFSDQRINAVREAFPNVCTSLGPINVCRARLTSYGVPFLKIKGQCAQVPERWRKVTVIDSRFIREMKQRGIQTHVWTVNDEANMTRLLALGVEGIMTDRAGLLKKVLKAKGLWVN